MNYNAIPFAESIIEEVITDFEMVQTLKRLEPIIVPHGVNVINDQ